MKRGDRGVTFNWMDDVDKRGNKRQRTDDGGYIGDDVEETGKGGKKSKGDEGDNSRKDQPLTDDEVRDKLTPLWKEYLVKVDPKAGQRGEDSLPYHLYKKTVAAKKDCLVKVVKQSRGTYQDKLELRNRNIKKSKQNGRFDNMTEKQKKEEFGEEIVYPNWTDKKANMVKWCEGEIGIMGEGIEGSIGYRNKCELTIKSGPPTIGEGEGGGSGVKVGFLPQGWSGSTASPNSCWNTPEIVGVIGRELENLLKAKAYEPKTYQGTWRMCTVRVGREVEGVKGVQVVLQHASEKGVHGKGVGEGEGRLLKEDIERVKKEWEGKIWNTNDHERIKEINALGGGRNLKGRGEEKYEIKSCMTQEFDGVSNPPPAHPVKKLFGEEDLEYELCGCVFKVSHGSFFQVNIGAAEVLYKKIVEEVKEGGKEGQRTVMFDVCCGTGSIGIVAGKMGAADRIVGCDISEVRMFYIRGKGGGGGRGQRVL